MDDAMAQVILSEMSLRGRLPGGRPTGLDVGGTNCNLTLANNTLSCIVSTLTTYASTKTSVPNQTPLSGSAVRLAMSFTIPAGMNFKKMSGITLSSGGGIGSYVGKVVTIGLYSSVSSKPGVLISNETSAAWTASGNVAFADLEISTPLAPGSVVWLVAKCLTADGSNYPYLNYTYSGNSPDGTMATSSDSGGAWTVPGGQSFGYACVLNAVPEIGYLIKSMLRINLDRLIFSKIYKPSNTKCQVDILGASVRANTATGGGSDYVTLDAGASSVDDTYNGKTVILKTGTGAGQRRVIVDYVGSTRRAYVTGDVWTTPPVNGTTFDAFDTIVSNVQPGFDFQTIDYTAFPTINILCSLEKQTGATAAPSMSGPMVTSIEKDWVSQAPVRSIVSSNAYTTALSVTGRCRLDGITAITDGSIPSMRITVDGVVIVPDMDLQRTSTSGMSVYIPFNLVVSSSLLVEHKQPTSSGSALIISWSK